MADIHRSHPHIHTGSGACGMSTPLAPPVEHQPEKVHTSLQKLDGARLALAGARTLPDVKKIRDVAEAAKTYAKAARLGQEAQNYAAEIALLAQRKAGEILSQLQKDTKREAGKKAHDTVSPASPYAKALEETQTPVKQAQRWQKLATIPQHAFERYVAQSREAKSDITAVGLMKAAPKPKMEVVPPKPTVQITVADVVEAITAFMDLQVRRLPESDVEKVYEQLKQEINHRLAVERIG
jgi:hypothetical protein